MKYTNEIAVIGTGIFFVYGVNSMAGLLDANFFNFLFCGSKM